MLESILTSGAVTSVTAAELLLCTAASILLGLGVAGVYMFRHTYTKSFVVTLALMPAMVQLVITLVNGNLGTGVAVMGAFSLVRFRSVPGSAREIGSIFFAMAIGLATGMGYLAYAALFLVIIGAVNLLLLVSPFGAGRQTRRELKITIPESLDYAGAFDEPLGQYTRNWELTRVRTTNLGSLFELSYHITLKDAANEKELIDALRCRNGNLNITCGRIPTGRDEL